MLPIRIAIKLLAVLSFVNCRSEILKRQIAHYTMLRSYVRSVINKVKQLTHSQKKFFLCLTLEEKLFRKCRPKC